MQTLHAQVDALSASYAESMGGRVASKMQVVKAIEPPQARRPPLGGWHVYSCAGGRHPIIFFMRRAATRPS